MTKDYVELRVGGLSVQTVRKMRGHEHISQLFRYEIEVDIDAPIPDAAALTGTPAEIVLRDVGGGERVVRGVVAEIDLIALDVDRGQARLVVRPPVYRQRLGRDCYSFQEMTAPDVLKEVLADYPGSVRYELVRAYGHYPYRAQYREDDWTYVSRLAEEEGIYYWFDHEDASVVFADDSTAAPDIPGIPLITFTEASGMRPDQEAIVEIGHVARSRPTKFAGRTFDMKRPDFKIESHAGEGRYEVYDAPGGISPDPAVLKQRMNDGLENAKAERARVFGLGHTARPVPGRAFIVINHPMVRFDGRFLCVRTDVEGSAKVAVSTRFEAQPIDVPFRPAKIVPEAKQAGLQIGLVIGQEGQEVHPDDHGRIRVILRWDRYGQRNEQGGTWMRIAQRCTPGSMLLPRMGWNVATFNEEGGVDAPSTVCRIHDAEHPPTYNLPDNKTRVVFKTATTPGGGSHNEIHFEDRAGAEVMFINASKDMTIRVLDRKTEAVKNDHAREIGQDYVLHVQNAITERVIGDQELSIGNNEELTTQDRFSKGVQGDEVRTIAGNRTIKAGNTHGIMVTGNRSLNVGAALLDLTLGTIGAQAKDSATLVGGAVLKVAGETMSEETDKISVQLIGGVKMENTEKSRSFDVTEKMSEHVGGTMMVSTNGKFFDTVEDTSLWESATAFEGKAPEILIEAEKSLRIQCGGSTITLTEEALTIEGTSLDMSGAHLEVDASNIDHN